MAEFKLGRIRFVWKDNWASSTVYYKDDVIRNGGNTYVCINGHTSSSDFPTDALTYWNKTSDGQEWKSDWNVNTYYKENDVVKYGGNLYIATIAHTSDALSANGLEVNNGRILTVGTISAADAARTEGVYPLLIPTTNGIGVGAEVTATVDGAGAVVINITDGGSLYKIGDTLTLTDAQLGAGGAANLTFIVETVDNKWDLYAEGFDYKSNWHIGTRYKINDIVKYNSTSYICVEEHTSNSDEAVGLEADQSKWKIFSKGVEWKSDWDTAIRYRVNDIVKYGGQVYVCNEGHTSAATAAAGLEADQSKWDYFHKGIEYLGDWANPVRYKINDIVKYGGGVWICTTFHTSQSTFAADEANWAQFIEGLEFEDSWNGATTYQPGDVVTYGGYSYIAKTNNVGQTEPSINTTDWDLFTTGFSNQGSYNNATAYKVGDVVQVGGWTYLAKLATTGNRPPNVTYWERLNTGIEWNNAWTDATYYDAGDAVRFGDSSYICILEHTSDETITQNRPDQDVTGINWNILAAGPETSVLTTQGDITYYGGAGATRLGIGLPGQILRVEGAGTTPEWAYLGAVSHVYYVSTDKGADSPAPIYGTTLDQPWKTIRYATEQVQKGPLRPNVKTLLELNRGFLAAEANAWKDAQIVAGTGIWAGFVDPAPGKCERDMGQIIDALAWDLSHGGNARIRAAALSYFSNGTLLPTIAAEDEQTVAVINYLLSIIDRVISNLAPDTTYTALNQVINAEYVEETGSQTLINTLVQIITQSITAGVDTGIPAERKPNNTIFVKTGEFAEVLPIMVPENTAVVGDELRSTRIVAAGSLVDSADTPYSLDALTRLQTIISNIVTAPGNVVKTTGNLLDPVETAPVGSAGAGTFATELVQQIYDYVDWGVNGATSDSTVPLTYGSNIPNTTTDYTYAVESIEANRAFIVAEVAAYIADTYPAYVYDEVACARDINAYLDAIKYDLIYTGNYKSLLAAKYYVNAVNGSTLEDMFYLRNGTGLRNCTVAGLNGTLGAANAYGTKRPTAGAYTSLDPGWGPDDTTVWITNKSPYVQNVTTFGVGCVGCKIDGALHNGGNDSIVSNDFTQILSDGIGVWCTNLARTELVSVFSYYGHIGYLAENGGKIRATNGNSSYGAFGTVAEGVDDTEVPINGKVNNYSFQAVVADVFTNGNQILTLEYLNAGVNYTSGSTTITPSGEGYNAVIDAVTTTDGGVFEVRLLDTSDDFGGADYVTATNAAQAGTDTQITLSNTDIAQSGVYNGMAVFIKSGVGAGQYAYIDSYNSGTKIATVRKMSDDSAGWDHLIGSAIETVLDSTTTYIIEPRISFAAPPSGLYADTAKGRAVIEAGQIARIQLWDPGTGYIVAPALTITDPNNTVEAPTQVRIGNGVLRQPTWTDRGLGFITATATISGDGYADLYQPGQFLKVSNLSSAPLPGSNISFADLPGQFFRLVAVRDLVPTGDTFSANFQLSPNITVTDALEHNADLNLRIRYSQVRLTGHDFLDIGTGNFENTNYPGIPLISPDSTKETNDLGGGRVFYTSTDQDGNFRVGELFSVEQSTGVATLNADAFNITGLNELSLGNLSLGGTGAVINEFSTDGTFVANSDNIVPTQKAIRTYITSQIGGGAATLNVNSITAGRIEISGQQITTTTGEQINMLQKINFVAMNYFLLS
jgi:hypothetical protein